MGVFLDGTEPTDPAPDRLFFADGSFATLAPGLRQIFFVGDGLTGTGTGDVQEFAVPDDATRLSLGIQDRFSSDPNVPGYYGDNSGEVELTVTIDGVATAVDDLAAPTIRPVLWPNVPNPLYPATVLRFSLPEPATAALDVFDMRGRLVSRLAHGKFDAGDHELVWRGRDDGGRDVPSGVYVARLQSDEHVEATKLILAR